MRSNLPFDHSFEMSGCLLCRNFSVDNGLFRSRRMTEDTLHERRVRGVVRKDLGSDEMAEEVKVHAKTSSPHATIENNTAHLVQELQAKDFAKAKHPKVANGSKKAVNLPLRRRSCWVGSFVRAILCPHSTRGP
jgi:hypothetical protein